MVARRIVDGDADRSQQLRGELVGFGLSVAHDVAGMDDALRGGWKCLQRIDEPLEIAIGDTTVDFEGLLRTDMRVADVDDVDGIHHR